LKEFSVKEDIELFAYLSSLGFNRTRIKQLLKFRAVSVNNKPARHDYRLCPGDTVVISASQKCPDGITPKMGIRILHEDDAVLVVEKPAGLLTIATEKEKTKTAYFQLNEFLKERNPGKKERIFIVHRLDRETSGLLVFAKTEAAKRKLQDEWADTGKKYIAVVEGVPKKN
jgi:23S rRNA pseudouridine1911/1915/1917 synthase